ncbi:MAG TPA: hypothetical protein VEJ68_02460 [Candidatus Bathyarchaeia archaeon]|nr:hypothetical protein [Candidatus Bathyarchaeia archaeon]
MQYVFSLVAATLLVIGLAGNGYEMRKIRLSTVKDEELASKNIFLNKRNFKWYAIILASLAIWAIGAYT